MLTALAICYFFSEISLTRPDYIQGLIFLVVLAAALDYGIWNLGDS